MQDATLEARKQHLLGSFKDYNIQIDYSNILINSNNTANISLYLNADYQYVFTDGTLANERTYLSKAPYELQLKLIDNKWIITNINTNGDEYESFKSAVDYQVKNYKKSKSDAIDFVKNEKIKDIPTMKSKLKELSLAPIDNSKMKNDTKKNNTQLNMTVSPLTLTAYSYNPYKGAAYGKRFGGQTDYSKRLFYTAPDADCTNFVSQCVWAAFDGYVTSGSDYSATSTDDTQSKSNISNKVRMVSSSWYGGLYGGGGLSNWESVNSFWAYTTGSSTITEGPNGQGYNNESVYTNFPAYRIDLGDVLQFEDPTLSNPTYTHSVYVCGVPVNPNAGDYDKVLVSQHSYDWSSRPLIEVINAKGGSSCYMRDICFKDTTSHFSK